MAMLSLFNSAPRVTPALEKFVRAQVQAIMPRGVRLGPTKSLEVYAILALDGASKAGNLAIPYSSEVFVGYLLDVGYTSLPFVTMVGKDANGDSCSVFSAKDRQQLSLVYPDSVGRLLVGYQAGITQEAGLKAIKPYIRSVLNTMPYSVEVEVDPFAERDIARKMEAALPEVVRYAETSFMQRHIFSPGWFAARLF